MYNRKVIGSRIRKIRKKRKLSQEELAELAGVSSSYIGVVERGEKSASIDTLEKIATALGTTLAELSTHSELLARNGHSEILIEIVDKLAGQPTHVQQDVLNIIEIYIAGINRHY